MNEISEEEQIRRKYFWMRPFLNEQTRRIWAAVEAKNYGKGSYALLKAAIGIHPAQIRRGKREIDLGYNPLPKGRVRWKGAGHKTLIETDPTLKRDLENLLDPAIWGNPEHPMRWISKSGPNLTKALQALGHKISCATVYVILRKMGYRLQSLKKSHEGRQHPDRNAQFEHIHEKIKEFQRKKQPVISVDAKKVEKLGNLKNNGQEYHLKGQAPKVDAHEFLDREHEKVIPYGVYDITKNKGWVNIGTSYNTAELAVESIRFWWYRMGRLSYRKATDLYITADSGGSNGYRNKLWKTEIQELANEINLNIHVSHYPPGTSKWNKIEHRLFCYISKNWRGRPLVDKETVLNLISHTTTETGLKVKARIDERIYEVGKRVSKSEIEQLNIVLDYFHGDWNYTIFPSKKENPKTKGFTQIRKNFPKILS